MRRSLTWSAVPLIAIGALAASSAFGASALKAHVVHSGAGAQTFTVNVDGRNSAVNESFIGFYPNIVSVHPGDTVVFHYVGVGEPHTVTLGTLTNAAVAAFDKLKPSQFNNPPKSVLAIDAKVPGMFPRGPGDVVAAGANPCFIASGAAPPAKSPCPKTAQPSFDGSQSFYNSGWLKHDARFTVHLSSTTPAGTYRFMCLLHREGMSGQITVVPASKAVASPSAQAAVGAKQVAKIEAGLAPIAKALAQGKPPIPGLTLPGSNPILAGSGSSNLPAQIDEYGPKTVHIPVGGSVTWWLGGDHSITFNATKADNDIQSIAPDGSFHFNVKAVAPAGGPGEPSRPPTGGSPTHINFKVVAAMSWNGKGFLNSGVFVNSNPPNIEGYKLTFTRAGTYKFICTVHDNMKGTVVVGKG